jgi:aminopeptidase
LDGIAAVLPACSQDPLTGGEKMGEDELEKLGANDSLIHVDWMIGSAEMDVDGVNASGATEPLMRAGEWV